MLQLLAKGLSDALYYSTRIIPKSALQQAGDICLMLHGITQDNYAHINSRQLPFSIFVSHMERLGKFYQPVDLETFFHEKNKPHKKPLLAITFDDGFANNLNLAAPWLVQKKWPATVFVTGLNQLSHPYIWADLVDLAEKKWEIPDLEIQKQRFIRQKNMLRHEQSFCTLRDYIRYINPSASFKAELANALELNSRLTSYKESCEWFTLLSDQEIKALDSLPGIQVGAHTTFHNNLGSLPLNEAKVELERHADWLQKLLGRKVSFLAFPDGSYHEDLKPICQAAGFTYLLSAGGFRSPKDPEDPSIIDRREISNCGRPATQLFDMYRNFN